MPSARNVEKVGEIKERLEASEAALFADYRGLSVPDIGEVRTALVEAQSQFKVLKNTLTRLAVRDLGLEDLEAFLEGPTAIAFVDGDVVVGAKALVEAAKKFPVLEVKGGLAEGRVLSAAEIEELASLDSREEMLAKLAGMMSAHMRKAAAVFQAAQIKFLRLLQAYEEKVGEDAPAEEPAEAEASASPDEAAAPEEAPDEAEASAPPDEAPAPEEAPDAKSEASGGEPEAGSKDAANDDEAAKDEEGA